MSDIGKLIAQGLRKKNLSHKDLAEELGIHQSSITKWISGKSLPTADKFIEIVKRLDIVEDIFPGYKKIDPRVDMENKTLKNRIEILEAQMGIVNKKLSEGLFDSLKLGEN